MGRHREFRDAKLYTRIKKSNDGFLRTIHKEAGMSKAKWVDLHIEYIRKNYTIDKASNLIAKTRNKISKQGKTLTGRYSR